ncbi:copper-binding protein [Caldimonas tepidiphila]|uniref:copper-binding protein n=1 Tax=Caldimonas tepidiphila TaxID=2315841 RepID=UPI000E5ACE6A|nr:copper-binding protein [Caldimonas tepidiphila]
MKLTRLLPGALALMTTLAACAAAPQPSAPPQPHAAMQSVHLAVGQVLGVDTRARLLTVDHQDIPSIGMPAMTMDFPVHESVDLSRIATGQTFAFLLAPVAGTLAVTALQPVKTAPMNSMPGMKSGQMPMEPSMGMMAECHRMMRGN